MSGNLLHRWIIKGSIFIALILISSSALLVLLPGSNYVLAETLSKRELLSSASSPRLIVVGGSNVAYGQDSEQLSNLVNRNVVNDGLIAPLGMRIILNTLLPLLHTGDVVVISPEYEHFFNNYLEGDIPTLAALLDVFPQAIMYFEVPQYIRLPEITITLLRIKMIGLSNNFFSTSEDEYNLYGDRVIPPGEITLSGISDGAFITQDSYNSVAIDVVNRFAAQAKLNGVTVVMTYPPVRMTNCLATGSHLDRFDTYLRSHLDILILSHPSDSCFPDEYFYNTMYHLNAVGRKLHTIQLAQWINNTGILHSSH